MRIKSVRIMLCAVLVFAMMALAACGSKSSDSSADVNSQADAGEDETEDQGTGDTDDADAPEETDDTQDNAGSDGKYATIADYVASAEFQSVLEAQMSQFEGSGIEMSITGEGDNLVYTYTYQELESQDGMAEALETAVEGQRSTFVEVANSLKLVVDVENPVVVIKYLAPDGSEIYATEIPSE